MTDHGSLLDKALGAYLGLALGDALGATVEFMTPREIKHRFAAQGGVHRHIVGGGWLKLAPGQVTDDTTMSLALGEALLRGQSLGRPFDTQLIAEAFLAWWRGKPVDCGNTCRRGILRFLQQGSLSGEPNDGDAGNGALMRNLPVALATLGDDAAFERVSLAQAHVTHHHPLSDAAVLGIGQLLRDLLSGVDAAAQARRIEAFVAAQPTFAFRPYPGRASGYVVDTVQTVLHCFASHTDFEAGVTAAVNLGDDADTTGALVGMLAGARCGAQALPGRWLGRLSRTVVRDITDQASALVALSLDRQSLPLPS
ncbi:ADP-ribosyl-[dinitrogen reductase] hydrolase [Rhizobacter sp. AJA081-3]|uniref:ADP-ribosyl-[dinitrogen reductase] hydrolase n=1 Tax=Rhizobacter sp. AJA081-3 TaxID=2753607 RepID=UPI001AE00679|nr:ADP-ribosyl-[dinitrogen reductase] hydrolase [Rhizobacter sp. AJA081-3]QTN23227.1 ADP-ribosyl-[dinitrogen reductase] hydrolase [Rhizobacter sp. AJA081-3]